MRVALIGGTPGHYEEGAVTSFLQKLRAKYPNVKLVTGSAKGAEAQVREWAGLVEQPLTVPPTYPKAFGKEAELLQVNSIIATQPHVIVIMGTPTGGRAKLATEIWHRMNMHERNNRGGLVKDKKGGYVSQRAYPADVMKLINIAKPPKKEKK